MKTKLITTALLLSTASSSWGAGFSLIEQSATGQGRSYAGSAAVADDASTIFFNPAGLTNISREELDVGVHYLAPEMKFKDSGSTTFGSPLTGGNGGDTAQNAFLPNLYYARPINDNMMVGLGINVPFGLVTNYQQGWKGRYQADKSDVKTLNINPSIAFKASDKLSLGFGVNLQKIDVELSKAAHLGAPAQIGDGYAVIKGDDWSWGYDLGLTLQATEATRIGLSYRSKISHTLTGNGKIYLANGKLFTSGRIESKLTLPETASLAFYHQVNTKWAVMADATWTRWSRFDALVVTSDNAYLAESKAENWKNSMRYGLGVEYQYNDSWTFRSGVAYDESAVTDAYRTARLPDEDRYWLSLGTSYKVADNITLDAGYTHIFIKTANINESADSGFTHLLGKYDSNSNIVSAQLRWLI